MRRRPFLRAAAIAGGAYYAGKRRMEARQHESAVQMRRDLLERLDRLNQRGVFTKDEFAAQQAALLGD
jgi:hypothetical protein